MQSEISFCTSTTSKTLTLPISPNIATCKLPTKFFSLAQNINRLAELDKFLQEVKVADLAVGSGAFPLGMLNEITKAREVLTAYLNLGRDEKIVRRLYDLKLETIKNSIFACDIEPSAVDIAKLRLWLTLVIDDEPTADKDSFKPKPLPNLDCNIICGNSLIDEFEGFPLIKHSKRGKRTRSTPAGGNRYEDCRTDSPTEKSFP